VLKTIDHYLAALGEEAGEVQQAVGKALRFGLLDRKPNTKTTNWVQLRKEVHDIIAVYELLCDEFDRVETIDRKLIERKKSKVARYLDYANDRGRIVV
jgi:NTP pyrophosphatase (non-canonical NTP hydrolase)